MIKTKNEKTGAANAVGESKRYEEALKREAVEHWLRSGKTGAAASLRAASCRALVTTVTDRSVKELRRLLRTFTCLSAKDDKPDDFLLCSRSSVRRYIKNRVVEARPS